MYVYFSNQAILSNQMSEFGHYTTSDEIMAKYGDQAKGKLVIVTGANSG
jgi:hypothetical protein